MNEPNPRILRPHRYLASGLVFDALKPNIAYSASIDGSLAATDLEKGSYETVSDTVVQCLPFLVTMRTAGFVYSMCAAAAFE